MLHKFILIQGMNKIPMTIPITTPQKSEIVIRIAKRTLPILIYPYVSLFVIHNVSFVILH